MSRKEIIELYATELAKQNYDRLVIERKLHLLHLEIARIYVLSPDTLTIHAKLENAFTRLMMAESNYDVANVHNTLSAKYAGAFVEQHKTDALKVIMGQLEEYQPPIPRVEQGIRMNCECLALTLASLSMMQRDIATIEEHPSQKEHCAALEEYLAASKEYDANFAEQIKRQKQLEQQYNEALLEQKKLISNIYFLEIELKRLVYESVQGNLSALPMDYRMERAKGTSVNDAIAISEIAAALAAVGEGSSYTPVP